MMQKNPPPMRPSSKSNCMRNTDFEFCTIKVATSLSSMTTQMFVCFFYAQLGSSTRQTAARFGFLNQKLRTAKALKRRNPIRSLSHQVGWQKRFQQIRGIFVLMCLMCWLFKFQANIKLTLNYIGLYPQACNIPKPTFPVEPTTLSYFPPSSPILNHQLIESLVTDPNLPAFGRFPSWAKMTVNDEGRKCYLQISVSMFFSLMVVQSDSPRVIRCFSKKNPLVSTPKETPSSCQSLWSPDWTSINC